MPKLGELIFSLAGKAGINKEDKTLKDLLALPELSQFELPAEFAGALEQKLLTSESAVANPDVRTKIMAETLNGVDARVEEFLNDFGFDDNFKGEVKGIKNSYEKLNKFAVGIKDQLKSAKEKANKTQDPQDKAEVAVLKKELENANSLLANLKRTHEIEIDNVKAEGLKERKAFTLKTKLSTKPLPKNGLDPEINILSANHLLDRDMAKNGLHFILDEAGNAILKQRKDGVDIDYFVDNKKVDLDSYIDGVLASNKFVQINDPNPPQPVNGKGNTFSPQSNVSPKNQIVVDEIDSQLAQLSKLGYTV